jgi:GPH family glycoside/pentoside/hexuronide:cation symporter
VSQLSGPDRVPLATKLLFGSGSIAEGTKNTAFNVFLLFYYNQVLELPGTLSGAAIFLALCVDAITDPLVGSISDSLHSRWGRRHPFMYASAIPMAICCFLVFNPPAGLSQMGLFLWLMVFAIGVRVSMTLYSIPSNSMVAELTPNYDERTGLVSYRFLFGWLGGLGVSVVAYQVFFTSSASFADGRLDASAYAGFGAFCAVVIATSILLCTVGTHRVIPQLRQPPDYEPFTLARFAGEIRDVLANRSYRVLIVAALFASVAGGFQDVVGLYMNTFFWGLSTDEITLMLGALALAVLVAVASIRPITQRADKKSTSLAFATFGVFFGPLPVFLRLLGWFPENGDPALLPILIAHSFLIVIAVVAIGMLVSSMIADTVDESELRTGKRQEGLFSSAIAFTAKATSGIGSLAAGIALDLISFPRGLTDVGAVPPEKVYLLGLAVGPGMLILYVFTLIFLSRYRITRARHSEILLELEQRKAASPSA